MSEQRKIDSFILYYDWEYLIKDFTLEEKGEFIQAIFDHLNDRPIKVSRVVKNTLDFVIIYLDRDRDKYIKKCEKNAENAKKRKEKAEKDKNKTSCAGYDLKAYEDAIDNDE